MLTGGSDGSICTWDINSGTLLQKLQKDQAKEVTGILSTRERIYTVGWDRKLSTFKDTEIQSMAECPVTITQDRLKGFFLFFCFYKFKWSIYNA